jgi:hypothetical protein
MDMMEEMTTLIALTLVSHLMKVLDVINIVLDAFFVEKLFYLEKSEADLFAFPVMLTVSA